MNSEATFSLLLPRGKGLHPNNLNIEKPWLQLVLKRVPPCYLSVFTNPPKQQITQFKAYTHPNLEPFKRLPRTAKNYPSINSYIFTSPVAFAASGRSPFPLYVLKASKLSGAMHNQYFLNSMSELAWAVAQCMKRDEERIPQCHTSLGADTCSF